jgi:hypothetical protein
MKFHSFIKNHKNNILSLVLILVFYSASQFSRHDMSCKSDQNKEIWIEKEDYSIHTRKQIDWLIEQRLIAHNVLKKELDVLQKEIQPDLFLKELKWKKGHFQAIIQTPFNERQHVFDLWPTYNVRIHKIVHKKNMSFFYAEWNVPSLG